jgi:hypothetical protein
MVFLCLLAIGIVVGVILDAIGKASADTAIQENQAFIDKMDKTIRLLRIAKGKDPNEKTDLSVYRALYDEDFARGGDDEGDKWK